MPQRIPNWGKFDNDRPQLRSRDAESLPILQRRRVGKQRQKSPPHKVLRTFLLECRFTVYLPAVSEYVPLGPKPSRFSTACHVRALSASPTSVRPLGIPARRM